MTHALRDNKGKVRLDLIPIVAEYEEAKVWEFGAAKYGEDNWKKLWGPNTINVLSGSMLRHLGEIRQGNLYDEESGLLHAGHIRCNAAMLIYHARLRSEETATIGASKAIDEML